jgi:hypothetical protein
MLGWDSLMPSNFGRAWGYVLCSVLRQVRKVMQNLRKRRRGFILELYAH